MSHFGSIFDNAIVLRRLLPMINAGDGAGGNKISLMLDGLKVVVIRLRRHIFLDSSKYVKCSLARLGDVFSLPVCKQFFPHAFGSLRTLNYM